MAKIKLFKSSARAVPPRQWAAARGSFPRLCPAAAGCLRRSCEGPASIPGIVDHTNNQMRQFALIKAEMWQDH
jgi:hypothetical protein